MDFDQIEQDLRDAYEIRRWEMCGYDPYLKGELFLKLAKDAIPVGVVKQNMLNLSAATVTAEAKIKDKKYVVNNTPFLIWQFQNAARYEDKKNQVLVRHYTNMPYRKMDAIIAMIMAEKLYDDVQQTPAKSSFYFGSYER